LTPARELDRDDVNQTPSGKLPAPTNLRVRCPASVPEAADWHTIDTIGCVNEIGSSQTVAEQQLGKSRKERAERTGFEPADQLPGHGFSKPALSTTQPPLPISLNMLRGWMHRPTPSLHAAFHHVKH
jgi:hypothetical protein